MITHSQRSVQNRSGLRDESGMALLIAVILLLLMSALGLAALQHSGDESSGSGRSRRKDATLYAAEAGQALAQKYLFDSLDSFGGTDFTIDYPAMVTDAYGNPIAVRSGPPGPSGLPDTPRKLDDTKVGIKGGKQDNGMMLNTNGPNTWKRRATRIDVTAQDVGNGLVHLQAQYSVMER